MCLVVSCQKAKNAFFFLPRYWLRRWHLWHFVCLAVLLRRSQPGTSQILSCLFGFSGLGFLDVWYWHRVFPSLLHRRWQPGSLQSKVLTFAATVEEGSVNPVHRSTATNLQNLLHLNSMVVFLTLMVPMVPANEETAKETKKGNKETYWFFSCRGRTSPCALLQMGTATRRSRLSHLQPKK
jgi:hypothetical protein